MIRQLSNLVSASRPTGQTILIGDDDRDFCHLLTLMLGDAGYSVLVANDGHTLVRLAQEQKPDLLLIDLVMPLLDGYEALRQLRNDTRTAHLPMLVLSARVAPADLVNGFESGADDYITKPVIGAELLARIGGHLRRAARRPVRSPLTGLPGNQLLLEEIRFRLRRGAPFALLHLDLTAFKAFNDCYGFARGDRAIHALATSLREAVAVAGDPRALLGHIGGDDFAAVCAPQAAEPLCRAAIARFAAVVPSLYDEEDLARGHLEALARDGVLRRYGLLTLNIGGVVADHGHYRDPDALGRRAAELRQLAKQLGASAYMLEVAPGTAPLQGP